MSFSVAALRWALLVLCVWWVAPARAADDFYPAAGTWGPSGHGWVVIPGVRLTRDNADPWQLYHVPPRSGPLASEDGIVRPAQAARLVSRPERLAAYGGTVWMIMGPTSSGTESADATRAVLSLNAVRHEMAELWRDEPEEFPSPCPSLVGNGILTGLAAGSWGVGALLDDRISGGGLTLQVLVGQSWTPVALPAIPSNRTVSLTAGATGPTVVSLVPGVSVDVWRCEPPEPSAAPDAQASAVKSEWTHAPTWTRDVLPVSKGAAGLTHATRATWRDTGSSIIVAWPRPGVKEVVLAELFRTGPVEFAAITGEGRPAVSLMGERAAVFWHQAAPDAGTPPKLAVAEVSLLTGMALYRGAAHAGLPITGSDVRMLLLILTLLAASVFVFVIRPDSGQVEIVMPEGFALAEPSTRVLASALDLILVVVIASRVTGISVSQLLSIKVAAGSEFIEFALSVACIGAAQGVLLESLFGRTVGKTLTGLVVARVVPGGIEAAPVWSALVRNLVKWLLVPVGLLGLLEHNARHRGDVWGRTVVVTASASPDNSHDDD